MKRIDLLCGNFDCPRRAKGEQFPVYDDGLYLWEMQRSQNTGVDWVLGDVIRDGEVWRCPECREVAA